MSARVQTCGIFAICLLSPGLIYAARGSASQASGHALQGFYHTAWTASEGLGAVFDIQQDADGYLWLTTSKGVLRFDGVRFQSVEEVTDGAAHNGDIDSVFLPSSGGVWLTTENAGLLFWKDGKLTDFPNRRCTPTRKQGRIVEDRDGSLWVQAAAGLVHMRGTECRLAGASEAYPGGFAAGIFMDRDGTLWVKTRTGGMLFLPRGEKKFHSTAYGDGVTTSYAFIRQAPDGSIWLSDDQGLRRVTGNAGAPANSLSPGKGNKERNRFGDFTFASDGSLWTAASTGVELFGHPEQWNASGAEQTTPGKNFTPDQGLSADAVWKVLADREGSVWIGTNAGLDRLRRTDLSRVALPKAQEYEYGIAAAENGAVWTGNSSLPLTRVDAEGRVTSFPLTLQVLCVRRDHNGIIWSAGRGDFHLWHSSPSGLIPLKYPPGELEPVVSVATDRNNDPWITTRGGRVYHLIHGVWSNQTEALGKKPGIIGTMTDDANGDVWFGFSNKVVRWDGSTLHSFSFNGLGVSENTMSVRGDRVWLGGARGVQLFTQGQFHIMQWADPNLPGRVSGIVETRTGDLWINGFSGITHVAAAEMRRWLRDPGSKVTAERLDSLDGLPGLSGEKLPDPSVVEAPDGRLWFATTEGIAWLNPVTLESNRNAVPPRVVISSATANGTVYSRLKDLTLLPNTQNLEIDYTALSLALPERVLFRYKLDSVDENWQNVGTRRQAFYTGLRPGKYFFHVTACNNDGVWSETGTSLEFRVTPAWYQTTWFRALGTAVVLAMLCGLYLLRVRQLARRLTMTLEVQEAERTRIARDLHDTLLQSFHAILLRFQTVSYLLPAGEAKQRLDIAIDQAEDAITEGRDAVQALRSSTVETNDLAGAIKTIAEELAANGSDHVAAFHIDVEGRPRTLNPILRGEVCRIAGEALRNAFRHAQARRIEVQIGYDDRNFRLRVQDDGVGMDPKVLGGDGRTGHFGLRGMHERATLVSGKLTLRSEAGTGTEIELSVPASIAYKAAPTGMRSWWARKFSGKAWPEPAPAAKD
jgi:signal transduction histidine kinase/ligand-binding sensor domain-containing protein